MAKKEKYPITDIKIAEKGAFKPSRKITPAISKDIKGTRMERTGKRTGRVHMEDGGYAEFTVDNPNKFNLFNKLPKGTKISKGYSRTYSRAWERIFGNKNA